MDLQAARFVGTPRRRGLYESYYLKASASEGGRSVWIRHTAHKSPGEPPRGAVWLTWFDTGAEHPVTAKASFDASELSAGGDELMRVGDSVLTDDRMQGGVTAGGHEARWDLALERREPAFPYLPGQMLYRAPVPRTKAVSLIPVLRLSGELELDGRRLSVDGWPGMLGHNWGAEHAERWVWLHGTGFEDDPGAYLDVVAGRVRVGPVTLPWIANGCLGLGGVRHRLGGPRHARGTLVAATPARLDLELKGTGVAVKAFATVPTGHTVAWRYADPSGGEHHSLNCSVADLGVTVRSASGTTRTLALRRACAYELGVRETDHGISVEPFPDP